jgi:hypothetical protein
MMQPADESGKATVASNCCSTVGHVPSSDWAIRCDVDGEDERSSVELSAASLQSGGAPWASEAIAACHDLITREQCKVSESVCYSVSQAAAQSAAGRQLMSC